MVRKAEEEEEECRSYTMSSKINKNFDFSYVNFFKKCVQMVLIKTHHEILWNTECVYFQVGWYGSLSDECVNK